MEDYINRNFLPKSAVENTKSKLTRVNPCPEKLLIRMQQTKPYSSACFTDSKDFPDLYKE
jgi:hypothetical protein